MSTRARRTAWVTVFKDVTSYILGWALIGYQALAVPPKDVNAWFLLLGGSLIGVPGIAEIIAWRRGGPAMDASGGSPAAPDLPLPR